MTEKIPPRFRKTKTEKWAVMAPIEDLEKALAEGGKIDVQKKSGDWSTFVVGSLGKPFDVDGVQMCYGYGPEDSDDSGSAGSSGAGGSRGGSGPKRRSDGSSVPPEASGPESDPWLARQRDDAQPPPASDEPMPEYQGGAEDEWSDF